MAGAAAAWQSPGCSCGGSGASLPQRSSQQSHFPSKYKKNPVAIPRWHSAWAFCLSSGKLSSMLWLSFLLRNSLTTFPEMSQARSRPHVLQKTRRPAAGKSLGLCGQICPEEPSMGGRTAVPPLQGTPGDPQSCVLVTSALAENTSGQEDTDLRTWWVRLEASRKIFISMPQDPTSSGALCLEGGEAFPSLKK